MSHKQAIIDEINELFRVPEAFILCDDVYKVCTWGACKSYVNWPDGAPLGWDDLDKDTEFFVGRFGTRFVVVEVADDAITKLYAKSDNRIEESAESICWAMDLDEDDSDWDEVA